MRGRAVWSGVLLVILATFGPASGKTPPPVRRCTATGAVAYFTTFSHSDVGSPSTYEATGTCLSGVFRPRWSLSLTGVGETKLDGPWNPFSPTWPVPAAGFVATTRLSLQRESGGASEVLWVRWKGPPAIRGQTLFWTVAPNRGVATAGAIVETTETTDCPSDHPEYGPPIACYEAIFTFVLVTA